MKPIDEQISQNKPFATIEEEVYVNLQHTAEVLENLIAETLKITALTTYQYNVLRILRGAGDKGLDAEEIARRMFRKNSDMPSLFDVLRSRGLIEIETTGSCRLVKIKARAIDLLEMIDEPLRQKIVAQMGILGVEMLHQLNTLLILLRRDLSGK